LRRRKGSWKTRLKPCFGGLRWATRLVSEDGNAMDTIRHSHTPSSSQNLTGTGHTMRVAVFLDISVFKSGLLRNGCSTAINLVCKSTNVMLRPSEHLFADTSQALPSLGTYVKKQPHLSLFSLACINVNRLLQFM
jgi:hypothetical protein